MNNPTNARIKDIDCIRSYTQWLKGLQGEWQELKGERGVQVSFAGGGAWQ